MNRSLGNANPFAAPGDLFPFKRIAEMASKAVAHRKKTNTGRFSYPSKFYQKSVIGTAGPFSFLAMLSAFIQITDSDC
jgi:hypothetical protein